MIAENKQNLQRLFDKKESSKKGLDLNNIKAEVLVGIRNQQRPTQTSLSTRINSSKRSQFFKYLGTFISSDGRNCSEMALIIAQAENSY